jgi:hypothetical protein
MRFSLEPDRESPKQMGAVLGLYDKPLYRDWQAWWTAFWVVVAVLSVLFPAEDPRPAPSMPVWLNAILSAVTIGFFFGFVPAYVRLLLRRRRIRRLRAAAPLSSTAPVPPEHAAPSQPPPAASPHLSAQDLRTPPAETAPAAPAPEPAARPRAEPRHAPDHTAHPKSQTGEAGRPAPIDALDVSKVRTSETLSQARPVMPYPLARALRAIQHATDMKEAYEAVLRASEALSVIVGVTATAWARKYEVTTPQLQELQQAFLGPGVAQGHWIQAARSVERSMSRHPHALPGMAAALRLGKGGSGLVADLKELVSERNRWAHGGAPRNGLEAAERLHLALPVFERALERARFLSESPWILTNDAKLRRREGDFQIQASRAMGDHPDFDYMVFTSPQPLAEEVFYLRTPEGAVDMTPLVVMRPCPTCHQREVAYADRIDDREGVALKTFDRGHVLFDPTLVEELRRLVHDDSTGRESETA